MSEATAEKNRSQHPWKLIPNPRRLAHVTPEPHLHHDEFPLPGFSIGPLLSKTEVDLVWWLFLNLSLLMGNQL